MYKKGQGVAQDYKEAVRWYTKAAEQGDEDAQYRLGSFYSSERASDEELVKAYMWYSIAAFNGEKDAAGMRDGTARRITREQAMKAQDMAREWMATYQ